MPELIPLHRQSIGSEDVPTANAREIHAYLGIPTRYDQWIKRRIEAYAFQEGRDFTTVNVEQGPVRTIEYYVTLDMAKQLAMVEKTARGKEARLYFLACERQAKAAAPSRMLTTAEMLLEQAKVNVELERRQLAIEATQEAHAHRLDAIETNRPPAGKQTYADWMRATGKPRMPSPLFATFKAHCRRLEQGEPWTAPGRTWPEYFYTAATLEQAYALATRQLTLLPGRQG